MGRLTGPRVAIALNVLIMLCALGILAAGKCVAVNVAAPDSRLLLPWDIVGPAAFVWWARSPAVSILMLFYFANGLIAASRYCLTARATGLVSVDEFYQDTNLHIWLVTTVCLLVLGPAWIVRRLKFGRTSQPPP
jgi:hypothetical protein